MNQRTFLLVSLFFYATVYTFFPVCAFFIFFAWVFLLGAAFVAPLPFGAGVLWGLGAYGIQFLPLLISLYCIAPKVSLVVGWGLFLVYCALQSGLYFFLLGRAHVFFSALNFRIIAFVAISWVYVVWLERGLLIIFDRWEGCCLLNPLVAITQYVAWPVWLWGVLAILGLFFLVLTCCAACLVVAVQRGCLLVKVSVWGVVFLGIIAGFFGYHSCFLNYYGSQKPFKPEWLDSLACVRTDFRPCQKLILEHAAEELCDEICLLCKNNPSLQLLITPEAALPCYLNTSSRACVKIAALLENRELLLGAYRYESQDSGAYNCCYHLTGAGVSGWVGKKRGVPFIERLPKFFDYACVRAWFLSDADQFVSDTRDARIILESGLEIKPLICSDLFFDPACLEQHTLSVALVNDAWFIGKQLAEQLWSVAWLRALDARASLLYCSQRTFSFIDEQGYVWKL